MHLRVLLAEREPEDVIFFREVLTEIGEGRFWDHWIHIEMLHAASWVEAAAILSNESIDLMLLDLELADVHGIETFRFAQNAASHVPTIVLIRGGEESLGTRLVREGAQDFLDKDQIDCAPLAHAMRNAIERHRLLTATRASATYDMLTGLPNRAGFLTMADRERKLAERLGKRLMVMVAEPRNLGEIATAYGEQRRDLALMEAADRLRNLSGPADLIARINETRFGLAIFDTMTESIEAAWPRIHSAAVEHSIQIGAAIFDPARPVSLEALLDQAVSDLAPQTFAMRI